MKLREAAANPRNEFDVIIHNNTDALERADEKQLSEIYTLRRKAEKLCRLIPYSMEDISMLAQSGEVDAHNKVAELNDCFSVLKYLLSKIKGEPY